MIKEYIVELTDEERASLLMLTRKGKVRAWKLKRAQILLLADEGKPDNEIAAVPHVGRSTVERTCKKLVEHRLEFALGERPRPGREPKLDDKAKAVLLTLAQSTPETVRRVLRNKLKLWLRKKWCLPTGSSGRNAGAVTDPEGTTATVRLQMPAAQHLQPVHNVPAAARLAARASDGMADGSRFRPFSAGPGGWALFRRGGD